LLGLFVLGWRDLHVGRQRHHPDSAEALGLDTGEGKVGHGPACPELAKGWAGPVPRSAGRKPFVHLSISSSVSLAYIHLQAN
jgi:hypothetical protein